MRLDFPNVIGDINVYMEVMMAICGDTKGKSMIDLGCNLAPHTPLLGFKDRKYIDINYRKLVHPTEQQFFTQGDVLATPMDNTYDVAIATDLIEHLLIPDGKKLLNIMENISDKQILFTPTTDLFGMAQPNDKDPEAHRSLWNPEMLPWYASLVFPDYHKVWNGGAAFYWKCADTQKDFERVVKELKEKEWSK